MKGQILDFNEELKTGQILGQDGNRYSFNIDEWKSKNKHLEIDDEVDFIIKDNIATEIFNLTKKSNTNSNFEQNQSNLSSNINFKKINFEQIEKEINHYIETNPQIIEKKKKEGIKIFFISLSLTVLAYILVNILFSYKWDFLGMIIGIIFLLGCLITFILAIANLPIIFTSKKKLDNKVKELIRDEKIFEVYSNSLTILNYIPNDLQHDVIKMISASANNYDVAKIQLIKQAYELKADAILNLKDNTNSSSDIKSSFIPLTNTQQIKTNVVTTYRLEGIAIKLH